MKEICGALCVDEGWTCARAPHHFGMHENEAGEGWGTVEQYMAERAMAPGEFEDLVPHGGEG